jgi:hypothetical protein
MGDIENPRNHKPVELSEVIHSYSSLASLRKTLADVKTASWLFESLFISALDVTLPPPTLTQQNCGIQAFRALFPQMQSAISSLYDDASLNKGMNRRSMEAALKKIGTQYRVIPRKLPRTGLALIEWTGTWQAEGYWGSELKHTHWVALAEGFVYDINWSGWLPRRIWEEVVLDEMIASIPKATGWRPHTGYELP